MKVTPTMRRPFPLDHVLYASPVLITECKRELDDVREALTKDLAPRNTVEKLYVADLANLVWEKQRLRRVKTAMWNKEMKGAVKRVLGSLPFDQNWAKEAKKVLMADPDFEGLILLLGKFGLDESAIEAEAMRWVPQDLEKLERSEAVLETRFQKTLRAMAEYRQAFADQARIASNRIIEAEAAPVIDLVEKRRTKKAG